MGKYELCSRTPIQIFDAGKIQGHLQRICLITQMVLISYSQIVPFIIKGVVSVDIERLFVEFFHWYQQASRSYEHTDSTLEKLNEDGIK